MGVIDAGSVFHPLTRALRATQYNFDEAGVLVVLFDTLRSSTSTRSFRGRQWLWIEELEGAFYANRETIEEPLKCLQDRGLIDIRPFEVTFDDVFSEQLTHVTLTAKGRNALVPHTLEDVWNRYRDQKAKKAALAEKQEG